MSLVNLTGAELIAFEEIRKFAPAASPETSLDELPGDSLEFLELLQTLEQKCNVVIDDEKLQKLNTVRDLIAVCG